MKLGLGLGLMTRGGASTSGESLGPELWPQPDFNDTTGLTAIDANWSISGGLATSNGADGYIGVAGDPLTIGHNYKAVLVVSDRASGGVWTPHDGFSEATGLQCFAPGTFIKYFTAATVDLWIYSQLFAGSITAASCRRVL